MGSLEVRNLLSKKLKRSETKILIIDDNQICYNEIIEIFKNNNHIVNAHLLDDLKSFEKQLNTIWDLIIFVKAYDIKIDQAVALIQTTSKIEIPILLIAPDDYHPDQYAAFIHKGIYDVLNLDYPNRFYINVIRALSYSRTIQNQQNLLDDLESVKIQTQVLAEEQKKAIASIQEGIHVDANEEYLALFGLKSVDDIIGLPLLDMIQPLKVADFKNRFKKILQGQFDLGRFEIETLNGEAKANNPLKIEFLPSDEADTVLITIETTRTNANATASAELPSRRHKSLLGIQRLLKSQPAPVNTLIIYSLASCPDSILNSEWATTTQFFIKLSDFIKSQTKSVVFHIETGLYLTILQAENSEILQSKLNSLASLEKPQLIDINGQTFQQNIKLGYVTFDAHDLSESNFMQLVEQAYNTRLSKPKSPANLELTTKTPTKAELQLTPLEPLSLAATTPLNTESEIDQKATLSIPAIEPFKPEPQEVNLHNVSILDSISQILENGQIQLKYQQLYDKQDSELYIYEVDSGFILNNEWKKIQQLEELQLDSELSLKVDRWILVEACKQLHNFITQVPEAKIIVNLNAQGLVRDKTFSTLIGKLITIIGSQSSHPLILQFDESDILKDLFESSKAISILHNQGAEISIRNYGGSEQSLLILEECPDIKYLKLDKSHIKMLNSDKLHTQFQTKIMQWTSIKPVEIILPYLDDMSSFANAWNFEVRFLQGDYFQKQLDHLTDVQDQ